MTDEEVFKQRALEATGEWVAAQLAEHIVPTIEEIKHFYSEAWIEIQISTILTEQILACEFDDEDDDDDYDDY